MCISNIKSREIIFIMIEYLDWIIYNALLIDSVGHNDIKYIQAI